MCPLSALPNLRPDVSLPLELTPLTAPAISKNAYRRVRDQQGSISYRHVLERLTAPSRPAGSGGCSSPPALFYAFDSVLVEKKGVTLCMATPMKLIQDDKDHAVGGPCLVTCGAQVVIKVIPQPTTTSRTGRPTHDPHQEIAAMQHLLHSSSHSTTNVIHLLDCMQDSKFVYLILPFLSGGDLFTVVNSTQDVGLEEAQAARYLRQIAQGLLSMKRAGLAHHDVSLENIMLCSQSHDVANIIDLGMCLRVPKAVGAGQGPVNLTPQPCYGKPSYLSPEVVREEGCDPFASDVWSLGVCLYMMLTARPLYSSPSGTN